MICMLYYFPGKLTFDRAVRSTKTSTTKKPLFHHYLNITRKILKKKIIKVASLIEKLGIQKFFFSAFSLLALSEKSRLTETCEGKKK